MRFVSFRLLRSLTARLLCIFLAALILTACATAGIVWYDSRQDDGQSSQVQLRKANEMIQRNLRFDSAKAPGIAVSLPPDLSRVFHEFATDAKFRILDRSGAGS